MKKRWNWTLSRVNEAFERLDRARQRKPCRRYWRSCSRFFIAMTDPLLEHFRTNVAFYLLTSAYAAIMLSIFLTVSLLLMRNIPNHMIVPAHVQEAIQER